MISILKESKKAQAIISMALIISMTFYYFILIGVTTITYASVFTRENVSFECYFKDANGNKTTEANCTTTEEVYLYLGIQVLEEGYINGQINLQDSNFEIDKDFKDENVNSIEGNTIYLNQINNGSPVEIKLKINLKRDEKYDLNLLTKETKLILQGTYTNFNAEKNIEQSSIVKLNYTSPYTNEEKDTFDTKVITNKTYKIEEENKRLIQLLLGTKLNGNNYPIEKNNIDITVPKEVEDVKVYSRGTYLTNGKKERELQDNDWNYNKEKNLLQISLENNIQTNENGQNFINWNQDGIDTLIVTFILPENFETNEKLTATSEISLYDNYIPDQDPTTIKASKKIELNEEKDGIINGKVESKEREIYKGKIYSGEDRIINSDFSLDIRYAGVEENIIVENKLNTYQQIEKNTVLNEVEAKKLTLKTSISKDELNNIIGENGSLDIIKSNQTILTINSNLIKTLEELNQSEAKNKKIDYNNVEVSLENNNIIINYLEEQKGLGYIVKNAEKQGTLNIDNTEVIQNSNIDRSILKQMNNLNSNWIITNKENREIKEINNNVKLKETVTRAHFKINNTSLNENEENKGIEFLALLRNDSEEYDLYKNPIVEIELPEEIENVKVNQANLLYEDNLTITSSEVYENEKGNKVIKIQMQGMQTTYNLDNATKGTYLVVNCDLKLKDNITKESGDVTFKYVNGEEVNYFENGIVTKSVNYIQEKEEDTQFAQLQNNIEQKQNDVKEQETTQTNDKITVTKTATVQDGADVHEREVIQYTIKIKNNTEETFSNITLEDDIPSECIYAEYVTSEGMDENGYDEKLEIKKYEQKAIELKSKEQKEFSYNVIVNKGESSIGKTIGTKAKATTESMEVFESNQITNKIKEGKLELRIVNFKTSEGYYSEGNEIIFFIKVKNISNENLQNIVVRDEIPEIYEFETGKIMSKDENGYFDMYFGDNTEEGVNFDETNRIVSYNINKIDKNEEVGLSLRIKIGDLNKNKFEKNINNIVYAETEQKELYKSNIEPLYIAKENCDISMQSDVKDVKIKEGTEFTYTITLKNNGSIKLSEDLRDDLPEGISGEKIEYKVIDENGQSVEEDTHVEEYSNGQAYLDVDLEPGETLIATLKVQADELEDGVDQLEVTNFAKYGENKSEEIYNIIVKDTDKKQENEDDDDDNDKDDDKDDEKKDNTKKDTEKESSKGNDKTNSKSQEQTNSKKSFSISGTAWLDRNQNGNKESDEPRLTNIKVNLLDEKASKQISSSVTDGKGEYKFTDISKGKYIIRFEYDGLTYKLTDYKKQGINEGTNSDVISSFQSNNNTYFGQTNTLTVVDTDITNIDIGLIKTGKFDLKLDKYITNITTITQNGTKTKEFKNATLGKAEIRSKLINGSRVSVTYNISVTNNGEVAGYANEITDYIPEGMDFAEGQNSGWKVVGKELKNTSLENETILPGETKELKLILTKKMDENNTGTFTNTAKITKSSSVEKTEDTNKENDTNKANVIISISTGEIIIRTTVIVLLIIAGLGIIVIIKKIK